MQLFENLSHDEQIKRYQQIATEALTRYDIRNAQLMLLTGGLVSRSFRVEAETLGSCRTEQFVLRIHRDGCWYGRHSTATIESELRWLMALRRDTELIVPKPVVAQDGSLVQEITIDGMEEGIKCVLLGWVEGEFIDEGLTPYHLRQVGVFAARLHEHALAFAKSAKSNRRLRLTEEIERPWMDWKRLLAPWMDCDINTKTMLSKNDLQVFTTAVERVLHEVHQIPKNGHFGLIHGDLSQRNYLFHEGVMRAIDFDGCCWNHHTCELAGTLYWLEEIGNRQNLCELRDALLSGYSSVRILPEGYEKQLETFKIAIHLYIYEGLAYSTDYDGKWQAKFLPRVIEKCRLYIGG